MARCINSLPRQKDRVNSKGWKYTTANKKNTITHNKDDK